MTSTSLLNHIREANFAYLSLAQKLIAHDAQAAGQQLGVNKESMDLIALLSPAQMNKIAAGNMMLGRLQVSDELVWGLITDHSPAAPQFAHRAATLGVGLGLGLGNALLGEAA